ncbi:DUF4105 domain-containing protein [uncultured Winogradskyella sp.]|uniref:lipoprotein N-acyltransferase Lnb domain-containing protein n=1 Tax=uncultured Winogradskyella sp. TaxID=395353 RepID=UPI00261091EA|nr:DUF4105 domain-containing protein [uncultured Winogradskyella sp.]
MAIFGQQHTLSEEAEVSVLTFGPGQSLNDSFGHNAFRITDNKKGIDLVYGYGEYDFDAPNFYLKFARGKLNYLISKHKFSDIYYHYSSYNRRIDEQVLNLSLEEKQKLFNFLENNYKPENRKYKYDFFYDNCATRIRDVAAIVTNSNIDFTLPENFEPKTFRALIHEHLNRNSWGSLGIDIALGAVIDKEAKPKEYMFLPKYIYLFFDVAKINGKENLIKNSSTLYKNRAKKSASNFLYSPLMILGIIAALILYITYRDSKNKTRSNWLDITLFTLTGIIGVLLLLLWFTTDHSATAQNYNVLWAVPLNIFVIGQLFKTQIKNWFKAYLKLLIIMLCLLTLHWLIGVQVFAIGLIPLLIALTLRYIYLLRFYSRN